MNDNKSDGRDASIAGPGIQIGGQGVQIGDHGIQVNAMGRPTAVGPLVVGDVPQEPSAFQPREDLLAGLRSAGAGVPVVRAVTGMRGVGKTQLAAAYARGCIAAGWRLVAWVNAEELAGALACLEVVADQLGIAEPTDSAEAAGQRVRGWLEADGERCLLVFDNVTDPDSLRPYIPVAGRSQVVLTGVSRLLDVMGRPVAVDVFTEGEALVFLAERTGLDDPDGARDLSLELGFLPLALAQAAAVIAAQQLSFGAYLERLRSLPLEYYLDAAPGEPYPRGLAKAILLSMDAVTESDRTELCRDLLDLVAVLSPLGVSRDLLYRAGRTGALPGQGAPSDINRALTRLLNASLLSESLGDAVTAHPLVARVARERRTHDGTLVALGDEACTLLETVTGRIGEPWRYGGALARDAVAHVIALNDYLAPVLRDDDPVTKKLLALRGWALQCLLRFGDDAPQAIRVGQPLVFDSARLLGEDHPETLASRNDLAAAYRMAGRPAEAAPLLEQVLADRLRVLGADHPDTLATRNNLALAYQDMGRRAEAIPLFEQVLADEVRVLGADHPETLAARSNLALTYQATGRFDEATRLLDQVLADRVRVLGADHPETLAARSNLALTYQTTGQLAEATRLQEQVLADRVRVLGDLHPDTQASRSNLALAYQNTGRLDEAIPLFEQALSGLERALGADNPRTVAVRGNLADARRAARTQARVFISHEDNSEEREVADRLAEALRLRGLEVVDFARETRPGENLVNRLRTLVRSADVILVILAERGSERSIAWQEVEVGLIGHEGEPIIVPVLIGKAPARLPYALASRQSITLNAKSERSYASTAQQVAEAVAARRPSRAAVAPSPARQAGYLPAAELLDISQVVMAAFSAAGRQLRATDKAQLLEPGPVWISAETVPSTTELDRFSDQLATGAVGYFVHVGDLPRHADALLDKMRIGGKRVVTVSVRALRAALADGRAKFFLAELERLYGSRDNLFDTKNALIDDRFLFGRDAILTTIGSAIGRDEHILVSGLRKAGKTSLLNILRQHLADHPVCMVDLERFDRHGEDWPVTLFGLIIEAVDRWGRIGREEWPFEVTPPSTATELARQLEQRFDYLGTDPARQRVVVMLDEIERVFPRRGETDATRRWIRAAGALRALAQGDRRCVVVIGADLRPTANRENDLGDAETNPFFSFFQEIPMSLLDHEATGDMLESVARAMGVSAVSGDFIDKLFEMTGGHPSLARSIAAEAYRKRRNPERMDVADLVSGIAILDESDSIGFFIRNNLWQPMTPAEKRIAASLSRNWLARKIAGIRRSDPAFEEAHASLKSQGIVEGGAIRVGLLRQWMRDNVDA
ncbi:MAG TPA: tetratricopeptide repeat protein [Streptosporangiaceae bacterium]|nr:tetratricopeptide repeat protein [Streptosporangiaceae bacterium]